MPSSKKPWQHAAESLSCRYIYLHMEQAGVAQSCHVRRGTCLEGDKFDSQLGIFSN